ncbi:MAG: biopolymer transporter ExbD [Acidobacteria bacterium]|nr:biopolymer transporter ExbD [Acidobacteriota bacterium]NIM63157.1 biopolymer transporter ExbD [Acidobacteriota bacterium]NIQ86478.1 biopolymer transporter ExbD [Acidobacteriota bacterium]NIT10823.1 biopolymer transporter ExbD [Acidobacteriota bacterium]
MARAHHYRRRHKEAPELDMTTFMNLMVVLVPFLLITAVFSRITIVELDLPSAQGPAPSEPTFRVEVVVREAGLEIMDGTQVIAAIPKVDDAYDLPKLSEYLVTIKNEYPQKEDASVLLEPDIEYDHLIQVMDTMRSVEIEADETGQIARADLFTAISIGDAP